MKPSDHLKLLMAGILGGLVVVGGFQATHSYWSYAVTIPLSGLIGFVVGRSL